MNPNVLSILKNKFEDYRQKVSPGSALPQLAQAYKDFAGGFPKLRVPELPLLHLAERLKTFGQYGGIRDQFRDFSEGRKQRLTELKDRVGYAAGNLSKRFETFRTTFPGRLNIQGQQFIDERLPTPKNPVLRLGRDIVAGVGKSMVETATIGTPGERELRQLAMKPSLTQAEQQRARNLQFRTNLDLVAGVVEAPKESLRHLATYSDQLLRRGFKVPQINRIGVSEGREILEKNLTPKQWESGKRVISEASSQGARRSLSEALDPLKSTPARFQELVTGWRRTILSGRQQANELAQQFKGIDPHEGWKLVRYVEKPTPSTAASLKLDPGLYQREVSMIRGTYDSMRKEGIAKGLDIGYLDNYLSHVWKESPEEIAKKLQQTGKRPYFTKKREIPTIAEGLDMGLKPMYTHPGQLVAHYRLALDKAVANKGLVDDLVDEGFLQPSHRAPDDWVSVEGPLFPKARFQVKGETPVVESYKAPREVAVVLKNIFERQRGGLMEAAANVSRVMQQLHLSGGIPKTPVNAFTLGNFVKDVTAGRIVSPITSFIRSFSDDATRNFFEQNKDYLRMMGEEGIPTYTNYDFASAFKNVSESKALKEKVAETWHEWFDAPTFQRFLPQLTLSTFRDVYDVAVRRVPADQARKLAGDTTKAFYGIVDNFARNQFVEDTLSTAFFAPRFRESMVNFWINTVKSLGKLKDPAYALNRRFLAGTVLTYVLYDQLNRQLTGRSIAENKPGKEVSLEIPVAPDRSWFIPILPSIATVPRRALEVGGALLGGDTRTAGQKLGSLASQPISLTSQIMSGRSFSGYPIYKEADTAIQKAGKLAGYAFGQATHPFIGEPIEVMQGRKSPLEGVLAALELPVYPSDPSTFYVRGFGHISDAERERYDSMTAAGVSPDRAIAVIAARRELEKAARDERRFYADPQARQSIRNTAGAKLGAIKKATATGDYSSPSTGSPELDALAGYSSTREDRSFYRIVLEDPTLGAEEKQAIVEQRGGNFDEELLRLLRALPTEEQTDYVVRKIALSDNKMAAAYQLAGLKLLTTSVVTNMVDRGLVRKDQAVQIEQVIDLAVPRKKSATRRGRRTASYRRLPKFSGRLTPPRLGGAPKLRSLRPPVFKPLQPVKFNARLPRSAQYERINRLYRGGEIS